MFAVTAAITLSVLRSAQNHGALPKPFEFARVLRWKS
jgi:hypothetical protein